MRYLQVTSELLHAMLQIFCHILWFPYCSHGLLGDKCVKSIQGVALLKHRYTSLVVQNMFVCYYRCKDDRLCQSLNFYADIKLCELNNRTHTMSLPLHFVPNSNAFYLENPFRGEYYPATQVEANPKGGGGGAFWGGIL